MNIYSRNLLVVALVVSVIGNWWFMRTHIRPRSGKDCSVEMKNMFDGEWGEVMLIHGYTDNYAVAKYLVDLTERDETARGGREKGSFRVKLH